MSEDEQSKVVWIGNKAPYQAPDPDLKEGDACPKVIAALEALLQRAQDGELRDLALCTWDDKRKFFHRIMVISDEDKDALSSMRLNAGVDLLKDIIMGEMMVAGQYMADDEEDEYGDLDA